MVASGFFNEVPARDAVASLSHRRAANKCEAAILPFESHLTWPAAVRTPGGWPPQLRQDISRADTVSGNLTHPLVVSAELTQQVLANFQADASAELR